MKPENCQIIVSCDLGKTDGIKIAKRACLLLTETKIYQLKLDSKFYGFDEL